MGTSGRCAEKGFLEFHHVVPHADGGEATVQNIELRCRSHNAYEAQQFFGTLFVRERAAPVVWSLTSSVRTEFEVGQHF